MNRKYRAPVLLLLAAAAFLIWWLQPSNVLERRVQSMLKTAEVPAGMTDIGRGARGPNLAQFLGEKLTIRRPDVFSDELPDAVTRDRFAGLYSAAARYCTRIEIEEPEFDEVEIEGDTATVRFRVDAVVQFPSHSPADGIQIVETRWEKVDGDWLLTHLGWEETGR